MTRKLRVAIVAPSLRILGGQSVQADVLLRSWRNDPDVDAWLVPVNPVPPAPFRILTSIKYVRTLVTEPLYVSLLIRELAKADVVHIFSAAYTSFLLAPLPAIVVARALGKPTVLNYHSGEAPDHLRRSRIARRALARVEKNVVQSRFLEAVFRQFGLSAAIVPNMIDVTRFTFRDRKLFGPRILSTRSLEPMYNVGCTLRAFREIQEAHPDARLTIAGSGSEERALKKLAKDLGLRGVTFAGRVPPETIARYYDVADIFVQTPNIDNAPLSVLEAFATGLPVVATDIGGLPAMVHHERDGLLAPPNDHHAVAAHVLRLVDDQGLARRLARSARERCLNYSWDAVRDQWLTVYRDVARLGRRAAHSAHEAKRHGTEAAVQPTLSPVRVIVFMTSFNPGGTERQTIELIRRLRRDRIEVHVACLHRRGAWLPRVQGVAASIVEFPIVSFSHPTTARQMAAFVGWCRRIGPTALHCTDFYTNIFGLVGGFLAGVPLRIGSRRDLNPGRGAAMRAAQRIAYVFAHVIVANSNAARASLRDEHVPERKIRVIANGVDLQAQARSARCRVSRIVVVANLRPEKAHGVLIDAAPALLARYPHLRFVVVGDGPLRPALEARAADRGVAGAFEFLGHREDVTEQLQASDVFVLPSRSEASPNAIIEAMASGLPVVACAVGGNLELVEDGRTGYLVPPDDAPALARAVDALACNAAAADAMGRAGRAFVQARYSYERMIAAFETLYLSTLPIGRAHIGGSHTLDPSAMPEHASPELASSTVERGA
jgi:glycosyltransferase involved in cell wall biosynthesis